MSWHARLGASSASRWMNCTASVALIDSMDRSDDGDSAGSIFAAEGTAAHLLGSYCLEKGIDDAYDLIGRDIFIIKGDAYWGGKAPSGPIQYEFKVNDDMASAVNVYLSLIADLRLEFPDGDEQIEVVMDMSWLDERFGGTADYKLAEFMGLLIIVDYKHGSGVLVEVVGNTQLKKYAVGALHYHPDCDRVRVYIAQPRAAHPDGPVRWIEYEADELNVFAEEMVVAARETESEDAVLRVGDWCRWCPASMICPEMRAEIQRQAVMDFDDEPNESTEIAIPDDLGRILEWAPIFENWFKQCDALAQRALESGLEVPGQKLVQGSGNRKFLEEDDDKLAARILRLAKGLGLELKKKDLFAAPKMLGPNPVEKMGKGMRAAIKPLWFKPEGKITMAPENDPRDAVRPTAITDFEDDLEDDDDPLA